MRVIFLFSLLRAFTRGVWRLVRYPIRRWATRNGAGDLDQVAQDIVDRILAPSPAQVNAPPPLLPVSTPALSAAGQERNRSAADIRMSAAVLEARRSAEIRSARVKHHVRLGQTETPPPVPPPLPSSVHFRLSNGGGEDYFPPSGNTYHGWLASQFLRDFQGSRG